MAFEYWPQRNSALSAPLLDLANVEEPTTVRDLQLRLFVRGFFTSWKERRVGCSSFISVPLVCGGPGTGGKHFCRMGTIDFFKYAEISDDEQLKTACTFSTQKHLHLELLFNDGLIAGETTDPEKSLGLRLRIIFE